MNKTDNGEFVGRRGELMAELFLQNLEPFYLARNNGSKDIGIDFLVGFLNSEGGLNLIAVEVKATEQPTKRLQISKRTHKLLASSNVPGILLIVDVKENRYFYHAPSKVEDESGKNFVTVDLVDVTHMPQELLLKLIFETRDDIHNVSKKKLSSK